MTVYYRFRYIAEYWSKIAIPSLYLDPPLGVKPPDLRNNPWQQKLEWRAYQKAWYVQCMHMYVQLHSFILSINIDNII